MKEKDSDLYHTDAAMNPGDADDAKEEEVREAKIVEDDEDRITAEKVTDKEDDEDEKKGIIKKAKSALERKMDADDSDDDDDGLFEKPTVMKGNHSDEDEKE